MKTTLCLLGLTLWAIPAGAQTLAGTMGALGVASSLQGMGSNAAAIGLNRARTTVNNLGNRGQGGIPTAATGTASLNPAVASPRPAVNTQARPGTTRPGTTQPATTRPGTTQPATTRPGTTRPGTTQPATTRPGTTQPGTTQGGATTGGNNNQTGGNNNQTGGNNNQTGGNNNQTGGNNNQTGGNRPGGNNQNGNNNQTGGNRPGGTQGGSTVAGRGGHTASLSNNGYRRGVPGSSNTTSLGGRSVPQPLRPVFMMVGTNLRQARLNIRLGFSGIASTPSGGTGQVQTQGGAQKGGNAQNATRR